MFLDGPDARARDAAHVVYAREKVRPEYALPAPDLTAVVRAREGFRVLELEQLTHMLLTNHRLVDRVGIDDLISVGLLGEQNLATLPDSLAARLRDLLENPES